MEMINRAENKIAYFPDGFRYCYIYHTRQSRVVNFQEPQKWGDQSQGSEACGAPGQAGEGGEDRVHAALHSSEEWLHHIPAQQDWSR